MKKIILTLSLLVMAMNISATELTSEMADHSSETVQYWILDSAN
jgi:hypothetical protein